MDQRAYRLPGTTRPRQYDVHLDARVDHPPFTGRVHIDLDVQQQVDAIELHARDLDVVDARLVREAEEMVLTTEVHPQAEMLRLLAPRAIAPGPATLVLQYSGMVSRSMEGLYLSQDGPEKCLATQCEETDARAIFPCFDEPDHKARIAWTVVTTPDVTVLANGPLVDVQEGPEGSRVWRFAPTKPMSSYLAAFCVGDFESTPVRVERGVPLKVWAHRGKAEQGLFARDFTATLLPWFEDYFAKPYHFDKYDQIAVPSFSAGAMENSGLVIFRRSLLLHDPRTTSWHNEKLIARVVAHEFAHQWFGNLVTMRWWDDIWLNESFAEWIAHKAVDAVVPDYGIWEDFQEGKTSARLRVQQPRFRRRRTHRRAHRRGTSRLCCVGDDSALSTLLRLLERVRSFRGLTHKLSHERELVRHPRAPRPRPKIRVRHAHQAKPRVAVIGRNERVVRIEILPYLRMNYAGMGRIA